MPFQPSLGPTLVCLAVAVLGSFSAAASAAGQPGTPHGYVEPCAVHFVETSATECELCLVSSSDGKACAERLGTRGYEKACRTGGHSAPAEVWCIAKADQASSWQVLLLPQVWIPASLAALVAAVLLVQRRRRARSSGSLRRKT